MQRSPDEPLRPILIVGAGPTGLVVAIELARRGIPFRLIDRLSEPPAWSRAVVIKSRTLEILAALGLSDAFHEAGQVVERVDLWADDARMASYDLAVPDTPFPHILSVPEDETIRILAGKLASLGGTVEHGVRLVALRQDGEIVRTTLACERRGRIEMDASVVVGADGFRSTVRGAIAVELDGHDFSECWGVFDTGLSRWRDGREAVPAQLTPPVVVPIPHGRDRWRVYFWTGSLDDSSRACPDGPSPDSGCLARSGGDVRSRVLDRLRVVSPGVDLVDPDEPQFFHSASRVARRFRSGRIFLAGDAAHVSNPVEGHGMNIGMQDAWNLGWKLAAIARGEATETLIESYEAERRPVAQSIVDSGDQSYGRMLPSGADALRALYDFVATPDGESFAALAESELALGYEGSPIVEVVGKTSRCASGGETEAAPRVAKPGFRVGDVEGLLHGGRLCSLHELLAGTDANLLVLLGTSPPTGAAALLADVATVAGSLRTDLRVRVAIAGPDRPADLGDVEVILDPDVRLHGLLGADGPGLFLVRPDGHLGFACTPPSPQALRAHLERMFLPV